jgi:hypothetical protein
MRKKRYFQNLYKYDPISNTYAIEVSLDDYNDVYDDWDPSPFKKRDIEDEFNDFIVISSEDIPIKHRIKIVLYLPNSKKDEKKESTLKSAYQNYYNFAMHRLSKDKSNLNKKNSVYLILSLLFLSFGYLFIKSDQNIFLNVLQEGIFIGGWVFLWEFFTNTFISKRDLVREYKLYQRLFDADIQFTYLD